MILSERFHLQSLGLPVCLSFVFLQHKNPLFSTHSLETEMLKRQKRPPRPH